MAYFMYVSIQNDDKIAIFEMDPASGKLQAQGSIDCNRAAPLAMDPDKRFLFAGRRNLDALGLSSFKVDHGSGGLSPIGSIPVQGDPVHMATDRSGKFLLSAYYYQQKVAVHAIGDSGELVDPPVGWLQTDIGAHFISTDWSNKFALVPHIAEGAHTGPNAIFQFKFDENSGRLTANTPDRVTPEAADGPRHLCFHPNLDVVYSSNEQGCSVTAYNFDTNQGTIAPFQTVPTLPEDYNGQNSCSQIQITPSGKFLYAPNRGHNSIAGYVVDPSNGRLTTLGQTPTEPVPRAFSLDPQGNFLYVAGLESGKLASYRVNATTGNLEPLEVYPLGKAPMWVLITEL